MKDHFLRLVLGFFLVISAVLVFVAVLAVRNIDRTMATSDWVNQTHAIILEVEGAFSSSVAGDGALRTFVLTGTARDQAACREALSNSADHLEVTKALTRNAPAQREQVLRLESLLTKQADLARAVMAARQVGSAEALRALEAAAAEPGISDIRRVVEKITSDEMALLAERDTASYRQAQTTRWTVWTGVVVQFLFLAGVAWLIRDDRAARQRVAATLREANEKLELRVRERTAELATSNERLATENLERRWSIQALEHQVHYNQLIINSINDSVFVLTKSLNISRVNPAVSHLTGWEPTELINLPLSRIVQLLPDPAAGAVPLTDPVARALKEGHDLRHRAATIEDKRGARKHVRFTLFPLRDRDKVVGGVAILEEMPLAPTPATSAPSPVRN